MHPKSFLKLIPLLLVVVLLTGCGAGATTSAPPTEQAAPPTQAPAANTQAPAPTEAPAPTQAAPTEVTGGELVVTGWAGTWGDCETQTVIQPFEQKYGTTINLVYPGSSTDILAKLRAEAGHPSMDVVLIGGALQEVAESEGLMETVDWAKEAPNWNDLIPQAQDVPGYGPSIASSGVGIGYDTEKSPFVPTSWMDLWDSRVAAPGQVAIPNMDQNYTLALFQLVNQEAGGTQDNVDPGFQKFEDLMKASQPLITASTQETVDALVQRGAVMSVGPNSRFIAAAKEGLPISIAYPKEGGFIWGNYAGVPKGTPNRALAIQFINFYMSPEVQVEWAKCVNYSPTNTKADLTSYQYKDFLIVDPVYDLDWNWINTNRAAWIERWNSEVLPLLDQ